MHLHWKHRELVKLIVRGRSFQQVKHIAISLEAESGGVLISLDNSPKGYVIIVYRGKNYQRPNMMRPRNLLTRRQALARSIELQRREVIFLDLIRHMITFLIRTPKRHLLSDLSFLFLFGTGTEASYLRLARENRIAQVCASTFPYFIYIILSSGSH